MPGNRGQEHGVATPGNSGHVHGIVVPRTADELIRSQEQLSEAEVESWRPAGEAIACLRIGGCLAIFERGVKGAGSARDRCWAAAAVVESGKVTSRGAVQGVAEAAYEPGLLFLRTGVAILDAVRKLDRPPDVLIVDATGRDHPRRAGMAVQLGALLDLPTVGVTHRPLLARGIWPGPSTGEASPLTLDGEVVGCWLRTRAGARPVAVHAAWRTDPDTAAVVVLSSVWQRRTPEPLREARRLARAARGAAAGTTPFGTTAFD